MFEKSRPFFVSLIFLSANALAMIMIRRLTSIRRRSVLSGSFSSQSSTDYATTLDLLFRAVKNPSRHSESSNSDELFSKRKSFFNKVYASSGLSPKVVIHVAGSKGKGSTVEYIASSLRSQGHAVGVFTSPHLHTARERIKIGKVLISREDLTRLGNSALNDMYNEPWTVFFDLLLTTALRYFGEKKVEYMVLEAGIGGRYDSTNFLDGVAVAVITSISLDHQALLGDTIEEIALQKAGVIKSGTHVFTPSTQPHSVLKVFADTCLSVGATLHSVSVSVDSLSAPGLNLDLAKHTSYPVQIENACVALAVVKHLGLPAAGMNNFFWPCRMDTFTLPSSSTSNNPNSCNVTVVLDGCHNGDSVQHFLSGLRKMYPRSRLVVLFGAGMEKCLDDMLQALNNGIQPSCGDSAIFVQSNHFRSLPERDLLALAEKQGLAPKISPVDPQGRTEGGTVGTRMAWAIEQALGRKQCDDSDGQVVAVCGSLFVAAEAREWLYSTHPQLFAEDDWVSQHD